MEAMHCLARSSLVLALALLSSAASAQVPIHSWYADAPGDVFGSDVAAIGDVNADGVTDVAIGMSSADGGGPYAGGVRAVSGLDGMVLWSTYGNVSVGTLGRAVDAAGDVNGDGVPDVVAGAPYANGGYVWVLSGVDGAVILDLQGTQDDAFLGYAVAGIGDVDGDGTPDVLAGSPREDLNLLVNDIGFARVYSGATGQELYTLKGTKPMGWFGVSVAGAGDVDGDGRPDFMVGGYLENGTFNVSGTVKLFSGLDGSLLRTYSGEKVGAGLGQAVANAGDVDADGVPDQICLAGNDTQLAQGGVAVVYSGATGQKLHSFYGSPSIDSLFLVEVSGAGDVDGDGRDDLMVGLVQQPTGYFPRVRVFSGADGSPISEFLPFDPSINFGLRLAPAGDVDDNGTPDLLVASTNAELDGAPVGGAVYLASLGCPAVQLYCQAKPSSIPGCLPEIVPTGLPSLGQAFGFLLRAQKIPGGGNLGLMITSESGAADIPFQGGTLCIASPITRLPPSSAGGTSGQCNGSILVDFNSYMASKGTFSVGQSINAQFWIRDPLEPTSGTGLTNAAHFVVCD